MPPEPAAGPSPGELPRLCYVGSLPVEATSASMVLLHRLLETYPPERLRILHARDNPEQPLHPERRLPGVPHQELPATFRRGWVFARRRLPRVFRWALAWHSRRQTVAALQALGNFRPEAVLTIHELFGWATADHLARRTGAQLHLVLHDEWFRNLPMAASLRPWFEARFSEVYRRAQSRLCVCPYMEENYRSRFGAPGTVLYPARGLGSPVHPTPPPGLEVPGPLQVAYGGNVFHRGYWESLGHVASVLAETNGQLHLFGPSAEAARANGLERANVVTHGFTFDLAARLRSLAHVLYLPMTFESREEPNMRVSFPSKLVEYTATGLPLLIHGPAYCSAVRWALDHPGIAAVVTEPGVAPLRAALADLSVPARRRAFAETAIRVAQPLFSPARAEEIFHRALRR